MIDGHHSVNGPAARIARRFTLPALLALCFGNLVPAQADPAMETRDPRAHFFAQSFGDLPEELEEARQAGKLGLLLFFEQEGCAYCDRMMKTILNQPAVQDWYRERFVSIAVDINGDVELRDVDGITLPSKVFAEHRRVKTTPTISFLDLNGAVVAVNTAILPGYSGSSLGVPVAKVHQYVIMCAPTMAQHAAIQALKHGERDVQDMVAEYDRRRQVIVKGFNSIGLPTFEPRGAFYCFPRVEDVGLSDQEFAERLLMEERVAMVPGSAFGATGHGHVRACYATSMDEIEEALTRISRFVEKVAV